MWLIVTHHYLEGVFVDAEIVGTDGIVGNQGGEHESGIVGADTAIDPIPNEPKNR